MCLAFIHERQTLLPEVRISLRFIVFSLQGLKIQIKRYLLLNRSYFKLIGVTLLFFRVPEVYRGGISGKPTLRKWSESSKMAT